MLSSPHCWPAPSPALQRGCLLPSTGEGEEGDGLRSPKAGRDTERESEREGKKAGKEKGRKRKKKEGKNFKKEKKQEKEGKKEKKKKGKERKNAGLTAVKN